MVISVATELRDLKHYDVYDSNNEKIGNIIDVVFKTGDCSVTKFVIGGSRFEELKEKLGLKPDDDPIVPLDLVEKKDGKKIFLSVPASELKNKLQEEAIALDEVIFEKFKGKEVISKDGNMVGRVITGIVHSDNKLNFILGDSPVKEFAERIGLTPDIDILVPNHYVAGYKGEKLMLSVGKEDLITTLGRDILGTEGAADRVHLNKLASRDAQISKYSYP